MEIPYSNNDARLAVFNIFSLSVTEKNQTIFSLNPTDTQYIFVFLLKSCDGV